MLFGEFLNKLYLEHIIRNDIKHNLRCLQKNREVTCWLFTQGASCLLCSTTLIPTKLRFLPWEAIIVSACVTVLVWVYQISQLHLTQNLISMFLDSVTVNCLFCFSVCWRENHTRICLLLKHAVHQSKNT